MSVKGFRVAVLTFFGTRDRFCGRQFFHGLGLGFQEDDSSRLHLLCTLFLLLLHSSTSDRQAFDPGGWGPLI